MRASLYTLSEHFHISSENDQIIKGIHIEAKNGKKNNQSQVMDEKSGLRPVQILLK